MEEKGKGLTMCVDQIAHKQLIVILRSRRRGLECGIGPGKGPTLQELYLLEEGRCSARQIRVLDRWTDSSILPYFNCTSVSQGA